MKRGQITIFMIVGIILVLVFFTLIALTSSVKEAELDSQKEQIFTKSFKKEALRIFVQDCLYDDLEEGLKLIGRQGRLWDDQPGGRRGFIEGVTGVKVGNDRVYYGIRNKKYEEEFAYPCVTNLESSPFCKYTYGQSDVRFGELALQESTIEEDLERFLRAQTVQCVEKYLDENIPGDTEVSSTEMEISLSIEADGIPVSVIYPLKLRVGGQDYGQLTTFDFFYPTEFQKLLQAAVTFPLQWDYRYVDFAYTDEVLSAESFTYRREKIGDEAFPSCTDKDDHVECSLRTRSYLYSRLGVDMEKEVLDSPPNVNGDTVFTFRPAKYAVLNTPEDFYFRIARQNRPPALDYVGREECYDDDASTQDYDYLVVPGEEGLDDIDITLKAIDPDEDLMDGEPSFVGKLLEWDAIKDQFTSTPDFFDEMERRLKIDAENVKTIDQNLYTLKATASDFILEDKQDIKVLVDRPLKASLSLKFPEGYSVESERGPGTYLVSREDPIILSGEVSERSDYVTHEIVKLKYDVDGKEIIYDVGSLEKFWFNLPFSSDVLSSLPIAISTNIEGIWPASWWDKVVSFVKQLFSHLNIRKHPFNKLTEDIPGIMTLSYGADYCVSSDNPGTSVTSQAQIEVHVKECVPHKNQEYPYSAPYDNYKFALKEVDGEMVTDFSSFELEAIDNPFLATHSCCSTDFTLKGDDEECFVNPEPGCYGEIDGTKHLLEKQVKLCDGKRGNICGGTFANRLDRGRMICGIPNDETGCRDIDVNCRGDDAFLMVEDQGWCTGEVGCQEFCTDGVAYIDGDVNRLDSEEINRLATELFNEGKDILDELPVQCGCTGLDDGTKCDRDYDGDFKGFCDGGVCKEEVCTDKGQWSCGYDGEYRQFCSLLGTDLDKNHPCEADEFCDSRTVSCKPKICSVSDKPECYSDLPQAEIVYHLLNNEPDELPFVQNAIYACRERGNHFDRINCLEYERYEDVRCSGRSVIVDVEDNGFDDLTSGQYKCGICGGDDARDRTPCMKVSNGKVGECGEDTASGLIKCIVS